MPDDFESGPQPARLGALVTDPIAALRKRSTTVPHDAQERGLSTQIA